MRSTCLASGTSHCFYTFVAWQEFLDMHDLSISAPPFCYARGETTAPPEVKKGTSGFRGTNADTLTTFITQGLHAIEQETVFVFRVTLRKIYPHPDDVHEAKSSIEKKHRHGQCLRTLHHCP
jgi:hypothetical protein